jgi:predicted acyl esterase
MVFPKSPGGHNLPPIRPAIGPDAMSSATYSYRFRPPLNAPGARGAEPPRFRVSKSDGMIIERDVAVTLRDGVRIYVDVFRPEDGERAAPIIGWGPYGKHGHTRYAQIFPTSGVDQSAQSHFTAFEALDPAWWVPKGYAVINPDPRGTWHSEGRATYLSPGEAADCYDLIEWAGTREWSTGKVGLSGVSYLASIQWFVAALSPPHLAAINPWEGWSDTYREVARHGGIPETCFWRYLPGRWGHSVTQVEDLLAEDAEHPLYDAFWASKTAPLEKITVPAFIVASWSDQGLHTRGTLEGFKQIASRQKWLEVHGRKKWAYFYERASVERLREFFDHFLLGRSTGVPSWPRVRFELRERLLAGEMHAAQAWPLPGTHYEPLFLDAARAALTRVPPQEASSLTYDSLSGRASFDIRFDARTDLVGHMKLRLWAAADADDMDLFVAVQKLDRDSNLVPFAFWAQYSDGPVALGWLRASHRELDPARSSPWQPVLRHARVLPLTPGEPTCLEIEIWPSGTRFEAGEGLRLIVQGRDVYDYPETLMADRHRQTANRGLHRLFSGARFDSHLLVPVVDLLCQPPLTTTSTI